MKYKRKEVILWLKKPRFIVHIIPADLHMQ